MKTSLLLPPSSCPQPAARPVPQQRQQQRRAGRPPRRREASRPRRRRPPPAAAPGRAPSTLRPAAAGRRSRGTTKSQWEWPRGARAAAGRQPPRRSRSWQPPSSEPGPLGWVQGSPGLGVCKAPTCQHLPLPPACLAGPWSHHPCCSSQRTCSLQRPHLPASMSAPVCLPAGMRCQMRRGMMMTR